MVVSNTSPLVYLAALGDFALLGDLFAEVVIPRAVLQEIADGGGGLPVAYAVQAAMASWLAVQEVGDISEPSGFGKPVCTQAKVKPSSSPRNFTRKLC